mmetsp:Transcript_14861/g.26420  ORF Transcript_14861/g.26420 Transcript_14861/m.26420 type:complete len:284 (+) Transcript_14861:1116-1967(+)
MLILQQRPNDVHLLVQAGHVERGDPSGVWLVNVDPRILLQHLHHLNVPHLTGRVEWGQPPGGNDVNTHAVVRQEHGDDGGVATVAGRVERRLAHDPRVVDNGGGGSLVLQQECQAIAVPIHAAGIVGGDATPIRDVDLHLRVAQQGPHHLPPAPAAGHIEGRCPARPRHVVVHPWVSEKQLHNGCVALRTCSVQWGTPFHCEIGVDFRVSQEGLCYVGMTSRAGGVKGREPAAVAGIEGVCWELPRRQESVDDSRVAPLAGRKNATPVLLCHILKVHVLEAII